MDVPVEAQSLSALTNLFANPPQYPRNPTHEIREPLVLYIVRVPGSKDVFLTPLKPPTKASISLEAIQSSLYYLHVLTDEDEEVKRSIDEQKRSEELERANPPIQRKPLPPTPYANYPPSERPLVPPKSYPSYQPGLHGNINASQTERYTARGTHLRFRTEDAANDGRRRSLSPRKFQQTSNLETVRESFTDLHLSPRSHEVDHDSSLHPSPEHERAAYPISLTIPSSAKSRDDEVAWQSRAGSQTELNIQLPKHSLTITLIRRDPTSGTQWNVGSLTINESRLSNSPLNPVLIELNTPGYSRFMSFAELPRPGTGRSDADSVREAFARGQVTGPADSQGSNGHQCFSRVAEYQQQAVPTRPHRLHRRAESSDSINKPSSPIKQFRQVFCFTSPWHGTCSFVNGIDTRSIKCRHTLSSSSFVEEEVPVNVAELRFNLPWGVLSPTSDREPEGDTLPISTLLGPRSGKDKLKQGFQHLRNLSVDKNPKELFNRTAHQDNRLPPPHPPIQSRSESDLDRLSLKLGREKAGGGFKGNSAKLGKLIIEDEGLKMCDLLVAACMGVWWQHYEGKSEREFQI